MNKILYLHGFNSSPDSYKAKLMQQYMNDAGLGEYIEIPVIPPAPREAINLLNQYATTINNDYGLSVVGSSLGGFYATWLAEQFGCRAVLVNPAVRPHLLLAKYLGENVNYHTSEKWIFNETHIEQLRNLDVNQISQPERYLLMVQTGDETLDYRDAIDKYAGCPSIIEQGGDHAFTGFDRYLDKILAFCNVTQ
jgi:predicted esterase YcpF (UPF0227 family)